MVRGQSDVSGTVLLVGVAVVLSAFVGGYFLGFADNVSETAGGKVEVSENPNGTFRVTLTDKMNSERVIVKDGNGRTWVLTEVGESVSLDPGERYVVIGETKEGDRNVIEELDFQDLTPVPTISTVIETPTPTPTLTPTPTPTPMGPASAYPLVTFGTGGGSFYLNQSDNSSTTLTTSFASYYWGQPHDYDGDGMVEGLADMKSAGLVQMLDSGGQNETITSTKRGIETGDTDGDGTYEIFYVKDTATTTAALHYKEYGGSETAVSTVTVENLGGVGDMNGDGDKDIVYLDENDYVAYYDDGAETVTTVDATFIGSPGDFDGDGTVRVPVYDFRGVRLVDGLGNTETINSSAVLDESTTADWDDDGLPEIVYSSDQDNYLAYLDANGNKTFIRDSKGDRIYATGTS